jgi:aldose 1-epimerase
MRCHTHDKSYAIAFSLVVMLVPGCMAAQDRPAGSPPIVQTNPLLVGGLAPVTLRRAHTAKDTGPEFLSVQLLPGRGLNVFQITGWLPGKGETNLLKSPAVDAAAKVLNGQGEDVQGNLNHSFGGAFLIPFSSRLSGTLSEDKETVTADWQGKSIRLPNDFLGKYAVHGLVNQLKAEDIHVARTATGRVLTAVIHAGNFNRHRLSKTDLHFRVELAAGFIDIAVTAVNVGSESEPMAIGWHPYLAIPSGDRNQAHVHIPGSMVTRLDTADGRPTGDLDPVAGTPIGYTNAQGALLPNNTSISMNYSHLERTGEPGSVDAWLADPRANYGIRVRGLSPEINTVHLYSPKDDTFAAIEEQFNFMDALGPEWHGMDTGMVTLDPGKSTTWHVRLELFTPEK